MPDLTSVKIPVQVRDRLAVAAKARGITVRALLDELSRQAADQALMAQAADDMTRLREHAPQEWDDYIGEGDAWEAGTVDRIA